MREVDYIIVGLGIAGLSFCEQLETHNKSFVVVDRGENRSTVISGGLLNPVILKRFTPAWMANEHMFDSVSFYKRLTEKFNINYQEKPIFRILTSVEEQNNWAVASDKQELSRFMTSEIISNENATVNAPFGFGKVNHSGRIETSEVLNSYRAHLQQTDRLLSEKMAYSEIIELSEKNSFNIQYKEIAAKKIVFCEGAGAIYNPFFPKDFLIPNKGEYLIIKAPELQIDVMLKGPVFIIPLGDNLFKVGATYARNDESFHTTEDARQQICKKFEKMISCDYEVVSQIAGIRPTTKDRRPLLGSLPSDQNKVFLNGLGSHGIMCAPFLSEILYKHLDSDMDIPKEMNIRRML